MSVLQYLTHPVHGCCTTGELMQLSKVDKAAYTKLRDWAMEEMKNKGIEIEAPKGLAN